MSSSAIYFRRLARSLAMKAFAAALPLTKRPFLEVRLAPLFALRFLGLALALDFARRFRVREDRPDPVDRPATPLRMLSTAGVC